MDDYLKIATFLTPSMSLELYQVDFILRDYGLTIKNIFVYLKTDLSKIY